MLYFIIEKAIFAPKRQIRRKAETPVCLVAIPGKAGLFAEVNSAARQSHASMFMDRQTAEELETRIFADLKKADFRGGNSQADLPGFFLSYLKSATHI